MMNRQIWCVVAGSLVVVGCGIEDKPRAIDDEAAIAFATAFYRAIAHGKSVGTAFAWGRIEIGLRGLPGEDVPPAFFH